MLLAIFTLTKYNDFEMKHDVIMKTLWTRVFINEKYFLLINNISSLNLDTYKTQLTEA